MLKGLAVAGVLLLAAGCGSHRAATPTPSVSWDEAGRRACADAEINADAAMAIDAPMSAMPEMAALRDDPRLLKAWCAKNYHG